jgi:DNA-binding NarL/FixJ family response regulator
MEPQQIILANEPRLLRKLLARVFEKVPGVKVVCEVGDLAELPEAVEQTEPHWMVVPLWQQGRLPDVVRSILVEHPSIKVMGMAANGSAIAIKRPETQERPLTNLSLGDLLALLRG